MEETAHGTRIPQSDLERLKEEISVQRLVEGAGIGLKRAGKDWLGRCPFHEDREASLVVTPAKNLWHCFGCQIGGGPIDWVMKHKGVSFRHAVELLRESVAGGLPSLAASAADGSPAAPLKRTSVRALAAPVSLDADDQRVLDEAIGYYHQRMQEVPETRTYLAARGLDHPQMVEHFKLGVADRSLGLRLPEKNRAAGGAIRTQLQRIALHRNAQRLLRPIHVVNPYADQLTFVDHQTRTRRDHTKYLSLIRAIALLHQHQREVKTVEHRGQSLAYIEVTKADIALANQIAHEVLGRTLDELPPQTRTLLMLLRDWVQGQCIEHGITQADWRFTRKQVRAATHWGDTQLKVHLARLVELEHLALHRKGLSHEYELVYDAKAGADRPHLNGLLSADDLGNAPGHAYDLNRSGLADDRSASGRGLVGGVSGGGRVEAQEAKAQYPCGLQAGEGGMNGHSGPKALFRPDAKTSAVVVSVQA